MKAQTVILKISLILLMGLSPLGIYCQYFPSGGYQGGGHGSGGIMSGIDQLPKPLEELNLITYPNPFSENTQVRFSLANDARVKLQVFDITGRLITTLLPGSIIGAGEHSQTWDGKNNYGNKITKGIYYYRLEVNDKNINKKIICL